MMNTNSTTLPSSSSSSSLFLKSCSSSRLKSTFSKTCCSRNNAHIPKLEPFSWRSKIDRGVREAGLIEKSQKDLLDYCSVLEGDEAFKSWRAYFEFKHLQNKLSKDEMEKLIHEAEGMKSLIDCVHGVYAIHKRKDDETMKAEKEKSLDYMGREEKSCPVPDGLPRSPQEVEEEEKCRMPDSDFTRLLRRRGKFPAWFSPAPDHETD